MMDLFLGLSFLILFALGYLFYTFPSQWYDYINWLPVSAFIITARSYGMTSDAWQNAFILAGFFTIFILIVLVRHHRVLDRIMLGMNLFFFVGGAGFILGNDAIIEWYAASRGGPFFGCIVFVGLLSTLFTKYGFIGVAHKNRPAIQYASFLLLAATVVALIWSVTADARGILFSVIIPFLLLLLIRDQLVRQMD